MSIRPIVLRSPDPQPSPDVTGRRDAMSWIQDAVYVSVCGLATVVALLCVYSLYLRLYESRSPSGHVFIEHDGSRVFLVQPTSVVPPPVAVVSTPAADVAWHRPPPDAQDSEHAQPNDADVPLPPTVVGMARGLAPTPRPDVPLPPTGLSVPAIDLDVEVRVTTSDSLPRQPYAGWFFRSAFPATAGNVVLLGHVDGDAAIFSRLGELKPGDEVRVATLSHVHVYAVEWTAFVDESAVEMLGPIDHAVLTLITCAGEWDEASRTYESRLVVRARYAAVEDRIASRADGGT